MIALGIRCIAVAAIAIAASGGASAETKKFPGKGIVKIGSGPVPLVVNYLSNTGNNVQVSLRDLSYESPDLSLSKELASVAKSPCSRGDVVNVSQSSIAGKATGRDAAGIGRFVWLISGQYTTDGQRWQFQGFVTPKDDYYNFNKGKDGEREFWAEVSTAIGSAFPGKAFSVRIQGRLPVSIAGFCGMNSAGEAIV